VEEPGFSMEKVLAKIVFFQQKLVFSTSWQKITVKITFATENQSGILLKNMTVANIVFRC